MKYILVVGDPVNGFSFIGPFPTMEAAEKAGDNTKWDNQEWWVAELSAP